ncbi:DNA-binding transcriptional MocR family regulator [Oxalobacteraceae bacterium GrIS 1.11]
MKRYQELAEEVAAMIADGLLLPGERVGSVRQQHARCGVSPATVFQAYRLLEARGLIVARPRSGYYVAPALSGRPPIPAGATAVAPAEVGSVDVQGAAGARVPFGSAFPSPLLFPMARLARAVSCGMRRFDPWSAQRDMPKGNADLRRQIALRYQLDGAHVNSEDIVVTNGALEALNLCLQAVARPGDTVLVESPSFYAGLQALDRLGLKAVEVATSTREGIELGALAEALARHKPAACWLMSSFQNPLGSLMPAEKKRALVALLASHDVPLIEDDVYGELYFGARRPALSKQYDERGLLLHCGSFSKCLAPGFRVGWVAPGRYAGAIERLKLSSSLAVALPSQLALAEYLGRGAYERHLRQLRLALAAQQRSMLQAIDAHFPAGTRVTRPQGGYFIWVEFAPGVDALALQRAALELGISIAPGPHFSASGAFAHCIRLNCGHPWQAGHAAAIAALGRLAAAQLQA